MLCIPDNLVLQSYTIDDPWLRYRNRGRYFAANHYFFCAKTLKRFCYHLSTIRVQRAPDNFILFRGASLGDRASVLKTLSVLETPWRCLFTLTARHTKGYKKDDETPYLD